MKELPPIWSFVAAGAGFISTVLGLMILSVIRGGGEAVGEALLIFPIASAMICGSCFASIGLAKSGFKGQEALANRLLVVCLIGNFFPYILGAAFPAIAGLLYALIFLGTPAAMICTAALSPNPK